MEQIEVILDSRRCCVCFECFDYKEYCEKATGKEYYSVLPEVFRSEQFTIRIHAECRKTVRVH